MEISRTIIKTRHEKKWKKTVDRGKKIEDLRLKVYGGYHVKSY